MSIAAASGRPKAGAARLDLLAAIRKGKKLKKKADRPEGAKPKRAAPANSRSSLMEAIRQRGGKGLKKVK